MRIPIRLKLAGALALPMVALIVVASLEVSRADARADEVTQDTELAAAAVGPGSLIVALQDERNYTGGYLVGHGEHAGARRGLDRRGPRQHRRRPTTTSKRSSPPPAKRSRPRSAPAWSP